MSVPFSYSIYNAEDNSVKTVKGILSFFDREILFEYKVYNASGASISTLHKFSLVLDMIKKIQFKKGFFKNKLFIETSQMAFLEPLPGSSQGKIKLDIKRADRDEAIRFSTRMNLYLSQLLDEE